MIEVFCRWCGDELEEVGATLTSPPGFFQDQHDDEACVLFHLCVDCFCTVMETMNGDDDNDDDDGPDNEEHDLPVGPIKLLTGPAPARQQS